MPDEIEIVHVDGIPYVKQINSEEPMGTALYVDLDDLSQLDEYKQPPPSEKILPAKASWWDRLRARF